MEKVGDVSKSGVDAVLGVVSWRKWTSNAGSRGVANSFKIDDTTRICEIRFIGRG